LCKLYIGSKSSAADETTGDELSLCALFRRLSLPGVEERGRTLAAESSVLL
jgi:hypothetical protein